MVLDLKAQMTEDLKRVHEKLATAQDRAATVNARVADLLQQRRALLSALDILEGRPAPMLPEMDGEIYTGPRGKPLRLNGVPQNGNEATLNGEKIILEPGFKVGKNSFGEDCIVPIDAADYPTMAEPTKPIPTTHGVILPATNETLDRPEDML